MKFFLFSILVLFSPFAIVGQSIPGSWKGDLSINGVVLPFVIHIQQSDSGYSASADSPKQGAFGIPAKIEVRQDSINISVQGGIYVRGRLINDSTINSTFQQGGIQLPLVLKYIGNTGKKEEKPNRPQEPKPPFPYDSEDFVVSKDSVTVFGGTITSPKAAGKYPALILISGSGQQNRDEELFGHKPLKVLADYLTRAGFTVLRFDDIGVGESKGDVANLTTLTQAEDVAFLLNYLAAYAKVDTGKMGLIGHSEGGIIAPIVALNDQRVKYIVSLAGMAIPGYTLMQRQMADFGIDGIPAEKKKLYENLMREIKENENHESRRHILKDIMDRYAGELTNQDTIALSSFFLPWFQTFVRLDPSVYLQKLSIPVMALNGEKDVQVIAQDNLQAFEKYLRPHKQHAFKSYPRLNHLFQTAETGAVSEYALIEETFNEQVMKDIVEWIRNH